MSESKAGRWRSSGIKTADDETISISRGKMVFRWSLIITTLFAVLVAIGLAASIFHSNIEAIDQFMLDSKPWLASWRLLLFVVVFGGWNHWSKLYASWALLSSDQLEMMVGLRWRIALWVLVMEAVFSQHVLIDFVDGILAGAAS